MGFEKSEVAIGEYAKVLGGFSFKSKDFDSNGVPVVKIKNVEQGTVNLEDMQCIPNDKYLNKYDKYLLKDKDILIAMTGQGSVGRVGRVRMENNVKILLNQRVGKIITDEEKLDSNYLFYILSSDRYRSILFNAGSGSGQPNLSPKAIESIKIPYLCIYQQRLIGRFLAQFDEKIEANKVIVNTLEQLIQALFKRWFIDFEFPNENEEPYLSGGGEMMKSDIGEIPKGWKLGTISEFISETLTGDWGREKPEGNYHYRVNIVRGADIPELRVGKEGKIPVRYILEKNFAKKKLLVGDVVVEVSGGSPTQSTGRSFFINKALLNKYKGQLVSTNFCRILRPKEERFGFFIQSLMFNMYNRNLFFQLENGTTGIKNLDITNLINKYKVIVPPDNIIEGYYSITKQYNDLLQEKGLENIDLKNLRDALLTKLITEEIQLSGETEVTKLVPIS